MYVYSFLHNEPTCLIEFSCINQLGCDFTACKRALLGIGTLVDVTDNTMNVKTVLLRDIFLHELTLT